MLRRSRVSPWLWFVLFIAGVGAQASVSPASASRLPAACRSAHHRCCVPPDKGGRPSGCLTIATAPNPSTDGQMVTISGRLLGPKRGHAVVLLWRRLPVPGKYS